MRRRHRTRSSIAVSVLFAFAVVAFQPAQAADERVPEYAEHLDLSYYLDASGKKHPIATVADWEVRKSHVLAHMQSVMGPLPHPAKPVPLDVQILEEVDLGGLTRRKIAYHTASLDRRVSAYLFLPPATGQRVPAVLCLHQTVAIGKAEPAGLGGAPNLHYALELAQRGYVTLAPDYPSFGDSKSGSGSEHGYESGTMEAIYDNMRAIDLLQSLDQVDPEHIGGLGHSLGGHNTMFTAAFEPRIKAMVSSCGFTRFHKYHAGQLKGWASPQYMPLIDSAYGNDPNRVPFDFTEIVASFAPRPFLAIAPLRDGNFDVSGVRDTIAAAKPIYKLSGAEENLQADYPDCEHDFPPAARTVAYEFLDKHLGH